jgi:hypothetical protein
MVNNRPPLRCHRGSCICDRYDLRITQRCLVADLGFEPSTTFADARAHTIVRAFESQRASDPIGTRTVGPAAGDQTVYRLGYGNDHRGATWHDEAERVVWLCAYGLHRSGEEDDAFPYFNELIRHGVLLPTEEDYAALFDDRDQRFADTLYDDAQECLSRARSNPGVEQIGILGGEQRTAVVVNVVETLEEIYVAFSVAQVNTERLVIILSAFDDDAQFSDWEWVETFPTRQLDNGEICCRILHG